MARTPLKPHVEPRFDVRIWPAWSVNIHCAEHEKSATVPQTLKPLTPRRKGMSTLRLKCHETQQSQAASQRTEETQSKVWYSGTPYLGDHSSHKPLLACWVNSRSHVVVSQNWNTCPTSKYPEPQSPKPEASNQSVQSVSWPRMGATHGLRL